MNIIQKTLLLLAFFGANISCAWASDLPFSTVTIDLTLPNGTVGRFTAESLDGAIHVIENQRAAYGATLQNVLIYFSQTPWSVSSLADIASHMRIHGLPFLIKANLVVPDPAADLASAFAGMSVS